jgi:hypothetical protein
MSSRAAQTTAGPVYRITVLVGRPVFQELSDGAHAAGTSLPNYVSELISKRVAQELLAPSPTRLAIPVAAQPIRLALPEDAYTAIERLCGLCGHRRDTVLSNLAAGAPRTPDAEMTLGFLRTDPGKGRIFGMYFEVAGFQYALLRLLAGDMFSIGRVLDAAFVALARQAASTGLLHEEPISQGAKQFASKMVMIENRRRAGRLG